MVLLSMDFTRLPPTTTNEPRLPPLKSLTFVVADDGVTTIPGSGIVNGTGNDTIADLPDARSAPSTVTISVSSQNDAPSFNFTDQVNVLERDDNGESLVPGWATNISAGPSTALDELQRETVTFTLLPGLSAIPNGLFWQLPVISPNGSLSVFPAPDQFGTAELVVEVSDTDPFDPNFVPNVSQISFTLTVQPVNDRPILDPNAVDVSDSAGPDQAYSVADDGVLTYTIKEDNTGVGGATAPYDFPVRTTDPIGAPYRQPGLLDVFLAGPANELDGSIAGSTNTSSHWVPRHDGPWWNIGRSNGHQRASDRVALHTTYGSKQSDRRSGFVHV